MTTVSTILATPQSVYTSKYAQSLRLKYLLHYPRGAFPAGPLQKYLPESFFQPPWSDCRSDNS